MAYPGQGNLFMPLSVFVPFLSSPPEDTKLSAPTSWTATNHVAFCGIWSICQVVAVDSTGKMCTAANVVVLFRQRDGERRFSTAESVLRRCIDGHYRLAFRIPSRGKFTCRFGTQSPGDGFVDIGNSPVDIEVKSCLAEECGVIQCRAREIVARAGEPFLVTFSSSCCAAAVRAVDVTCILVCGSHATEVFCTLVNHSSSSTDLCVRAVVSCQPGTHVLRFTFRGDGSKMRC
jgi:hypothetical protein